MAEPTALSLRHLLGLHDFLSFGYEVPEKDAVARPLRLLFFLSFFFLLLFDKEEEEEKKKKRKKLICKIITCNSFRRLKR